ncbi:hypothetical protein [Plasmodium yoelii yoelii]|uniref:Uncharacterized protein n=1 Tax=Plasmodium yoelii yoelii TaxID=73239 RepID=Q7RL85_PLAYO|nr:hypothetical protein [Plasmodium yoelii yoelii]
MGKLIKYWNRCRTMMPKHQLGPRRKH